MLLIVTAEVMNQASQGELTVLRESAAAFQLSCVDVREQIRRPAASGAELGEGAKRICLQEVEPPQIRSEVGVDEDRSDPERVFNYNSSGFGPPGRRALPRPLRPAPYPTKVTLDPVK